MRWISFVLGTIALGILFGVAHGGVGDWVQPELKGPRSAVAVDLALAVAESGEAAVDGFVSAREDLTSFVAARLARAELTPPAALKEIELGLPGAQAVLLERAGAEVLRSGEPEILPSEGPQTTLLDDALLVSRASGVWRVSVLFELGSRVFQELPPFGTALLQWQSDERTLAEHGDRSLGERRAEAQALAGVTSRKAYVQGSQIEVLALPPPARVTPRLREGIMWLGLGAFGILALTILLAPVGPRPARAAAADDSTSTKIPAPGAADVPSDAEAEPVRARQPEADPRSAPEPEPEPEPQPEPQPEPEAQAEPPSESDPVDGEERFPPPSEDLSSERMAALGFASSRGESLAAEDEDETEAREGPSAVPSEPMQSVSLPSLRPGAEAEDEGDGWAPALPETRTQPQWPQDSGETEATKAEASTPDGGERAADEPTEPPPRTPAAQPRDASLIPGAHPESEVVSDVLPFDPVHYQEVYQAFVEARARVGAPATGVSQQAFSRKLESSERSLIEKHSCRAVRFEVVEREGKVTLRPQLVR